jgi:membrane-bound lytic murein transglycosylase F
MRKISQVKVLFFAVLWLLFQACTSTGNDTSSKTSVNKKDLPEIIKNGKLTVLFENSSTSYFIYRGNKMGFEYEMLQEFAREIGVQLEVVLINDLDNIHDQLNTYKVDVIACNYTVSNDRKKEIDFSNPYLLTPQVLVQRKPEVDEESFNDENSTQILKDPTQLASKKIHVWKNSSYYQRLIHLQEEIGDTILIQEVPGNVTAEELIDRVSEGIIDYTVVEKNVALINSKFFDNLDVDLEISFKQKIAFALRKTNPLLRVRLNEWLDKYSKSTNFTYLKRKYFDLAQVSIHNEMSSLGGGQLSKYDKIFKKEAEKHKLDWRLAASIAYQESKFNPNAIGFGGTYGIMQFMPGTGPKYGVYPSSPVEIQIAGGTKKLSGDLKTWSSIPNKDQQAKFALATYNAGLGHIQDAQRLAKKHGLNPSVWDGNVEEMVKKLSEREYYTDEVVKHGAMRGNHTIKYVKSVFNRYQSYKSSFR